MSRIGVDACYHSVVTVALDAIVDRYLSSGDFNGLPLRDVGAQAVAELPSLVRDGLVQVMSSEDYINPHIRPWPSKRSVDEQIASLTEADKGCCLYPAPKAMTDRLDPEMYRSEPYKRRLATGNGSLEPVYFRFDVLEVYRNDPRYNFQFDDFGASIATSSAVYDDEAEPAGDKIYISHVGFAYDTSSRPTAHGASYYPASLRISDGLGEA